MGLRPVQSSRAFFSERTYLGKAELQTSLETFLTEYCGEFSAALNSH